MIKKILFLGGLLMCVVYNLELFAAPPKSLQYNSLEYQTNFATPGSTSAPRVDWGGTRGIFKLDSNLKQVSIDSISGVVSWKNNIPLGKNTIKVIAQNSSGQVSTEFVINHIFEGTFRGGYNSDIRSYKAPGNTFAISFTPLNKVFIENNTRTGNGKWWGANINNKIEGMYSYDEKSFYRFECTLRYSAEGIPFLMGHWKAEKSAAWQGNFNIVFENHQLSETSDAAIIKNASQKTKQIFSGQNLSSDSSTTNISKESKTSSNPGEGPFGFTYSIDNREAKYGVSFYTTGSTLNPKIEWGKERGNIHGARSYPGVKVDANLGVIDWDKDLPLGNNIVEVIAENSKGKASAKVNLFHVFEGKFQGGYSNNPNSKSLVTKEFVILFYNDGTLQVENKVGNKVDRGEGQWTYGDKNTINGSFKYGDGTLQVFQASVTYSNSTKPFLTGLLKNKNNPNWQSYFRLDYLGLR